MEERRKKAMLYISCSHRRLVYMAVVGGGAWELRKKKRIRKHKMLGEGPNVLRQWFSTCGA